MPKQLFYSPIKKLMDGDNKYSRAIKVPQYEPSNVKPKIWELYEFLMFAATRHIVFNYAKIADYYAHAEPEIQRLMEQSALVIIDIDDAIANGYVKLSKRMEELVQESKSRRINND